LLKGEKVEGKKEIPGWNETKKKGETKPFNSGKKHAQIVGE